MLGGRVVRLRAALSIAFRSANAFIKGVEGRLCQGPSAPAVPNGGTHYRRAYRREGVSHGSRTVCRNGFGPRGTREVVRLVRPSADPLRPPTDFDEVVDWFEQVSYQLVLLEDHPLGDVRVALQQFEHAVREHQRTFETRLGLSSSPSRELSEGKAILSSDHAWFVISLEQLEWFYRIVEGEDHGGHRQALGQYGRVLAEALRRHRRDERAYLAGTSEPTDGAPL